jgi:FKBP-type peptidyl-prolyl cis-trans isomerase FkpA
MAASALHMNQAKMLVVIFAGVLALAVANAQEPTAAPTDAAKKIDTKKTEAKKTDKKAEAKPAATDAAKKEDTLPKDVKKLVVQDTIQGAGKEASKGKTIKVNYTGWLYDPTQPMGRGKQFDTSIGKDPFAFKLGGGEVIKGWDDGFEKMKVGGKRKLIIPAEMGYGARGAGTVIPPNAPLMFEVELIDVM